MPVFLWWLLGLGGLFTAAVALKKKAEPPPPPEVPPYLPSYTPMAHAPPPEPVPVAVPVPVPVPIPVPQKIEEKFDKGLSGIEIVAVVYALAKEQDPKRLREFADLFAPDFPIVATRLRTQAVLVREKVTPVAAKLAPMVMTATRAAALTSKLTATSAAKSTKFGEEPRFWSTFFVPPGVKPIYLDPGRWTETERALDVQNKMIQDVYANTRVQVAKFDQGLGGPAKGDAKFNTEHPTFELSLGEALKSIYYDDEGQKNEKLRSKGFFAGLFSFIGDVFKAVMTVYFSATKIVAPFLSYIPGIGSLAAGIMTAGADLAMGEPIDKAFLNAARASLPGAPASQLAFDAGVAILSGVAKGESFDAIVAKTGIETLGSQIPIPKGVNKDIATQVFQRGVAIAQGKNLQDLGFNVVSKYLPGKDSFERVAGFANAVRQSKETGRPVDEIVTTKFYGELLSVDRKGFRELIDAMTREPDLMKISPEELAAKKGVPEPVARAALASVKVLPIPQWMNDRLGLPPILYPDTELLRKVEAMHVPAVVAVAKAKVLKMRKRAEMAKAYARGASMLRMAMDKKKAEEAKGMG